MFRLNSIPLLLVIFVNSFAQNVITFRVNLKEAISKDIFLPESGDSVLVMGSFNSWSTNDYKLADKTGDSVYSGEFNIRGDPDSFIEYKFIILKSVGGIIWESDPEPDNPPNGNRKLTLTGNPQILSVQNFHLTDIDTI